MHDFLPKEAAALVQLERTFREVTSRYGFAEVRTPLVEHTELFLRSIGEVTDIVEKEMYTFDDGKKSLTLRPEGTASCVRAYLQHSVHGKESVSKWAYLGPMYRRERPAKGRYRQFFQVGCEVYGDEGPVVDAEVIELAVRFIEALGITGVRVLINSLGGEETRAAYRDALVDYLTPQKDKLSEDSQRRLTLNPLRVLDSKAPQDQEIAAGAPQLSSFLTEEDTAHFKGVQTALSALNVEFEVEYRLVRGLDYYTRTLFEVKGPGDLGNQDTLCGGGRYDRMIEELGGPKTPAIGFAMGVERLLISMGDAQKEKHAKEAALDAFLVVGSELETQAISIASQLRSAGVSVDLDGRGRSFKSQFRRADKSGARHALVFGSDEAEAGVMQVKHLESGKQSQVPISELADALIAAR